MQGVVLVMQGKVVILLDKLFVCASPVLCMHVLGPVLFCKDMFDSAVDQPLFCMVACTMYTGSADCQRHLRDDAISGCKAELLNPACTSYG